MKYIPMKYSSNYISCLHNKSVHPLKGLVWTNPAWKKHMLCTNITAILYIVIVMVLFKIGIPQGYYQWLRCKINESIDWSTDPFMISGQITGVNIIQAILFMLPVFIIPLMFWMFFKVKQFNQYRAAGLIQMSPFDNSTYLHFMKLYKNAEQLIELLNSDKKVEIKLAQKEYIQITITDSIITKEIELYFGDYINQIFDKRIIDFSVLDTEIEKYLSEEDKYESSNI